MAEPARFPVPKSESHRLDPFSGKPHPGGGCWDAGLGERTVLGRAEPEAQTKVRRDFKGPTDLAPSVPPALPPCPCHLHTSLGRRSPLENGSHTGCKIKSSLSLRFAEPRCSQRSYCLWVLCSRGFFFVIIQSLQNPGWVEAEGGSVGGPGDVRGRH